MSHARFYHLSSLFSVSPRLFLCVRFSSIKKNNSKITSCLALSFSWPCSLFFGRKNYDEHSFFLLSFEYFRLTRPALRRLSTSLLLVFLWGRSYTRQLYLLSSLLCSARSRSKRTVLPTTFLFCGHDDSVVDAAMAGRSNEAIYFPFNQIYLLPSQSNLKLLFFFFFWFPRVGMGCSMSKQVDCTSQGKSCSSSQLAKGVLVFSMCHVARKTYENNQRFQYKTLPLIF